MNWSTRHSATTHVPEQVLFNYPGGKEALKPEAPARDLFPSLRFFGLVCFFRDEGISTHPGVGLRLASSSCQRVYRRSTVRWASSSARQASARTT